MGFLLIFIDGFELYVTYKGQAVTRTLWGDMGYVCEKRMLKFAKLGHTFCNQQTDNLIKKSKFVQMHARNRDAVANSSLSFCFKSSYKFVEKPQAFDRIEWSVDLTGEEIQSVRLFDKACSILTL